MLRLRGEGVHELRGAETGAGIVGLTIHPVKHAAIKPAHRALVGFAVEAFHVLGREGALR